MVFIAVKSQRSHSAGRWTTDWSRWLWPTMVTLTCKHPPASNNTDLQTLTSCCRTNGLLLKPVDVWLQVGIVQTTCGRFCWKTTSREAELNLCPFVAVDFPSSFLFTVFYTLFHKSLHKFSVFFWKSAFAFLPSTDSKIKSKVVEEGNLKTKILLYKHKSSFIVFFTPEWDCLCRTNSLQSYRSYQITLFYCGGEPFSKCNESQSLCHLCQPLSPILQAYFCTILVQHDMYLV